MTNVYKLDTAWTPQTPPTHEQVTINLSEKGGDTHSFECDAGIAPLIREFWLAGIPTIHSCERTDQGAYVLIPSKKDKLKLNKILNMASPTIARRWISCGAGQHSIVFSHDLIPAFTSRLQAHNQAALVGAPSGR